MKTLRVNRMLSLLFLLSGWVVGYGQEMEVPGDHFSLEGALELFKKSESPEEFEKLLNSSESKVNNLDLNGDGYIDYVRVIDRNEGNVHAFILRAIVSETESQDVAVIELEKLANGKAILQITGDEDVYGIETIIEPTKEVRVNAGTSTQRTVVNVWAWPSVQYVYGPYYSTWISPWGWSSRPAWWHTWRPVTYYEYNPWWQPYRPYYSVCYTHRVYYAQHIYQPYRTTSVVVYNRHNNQIANYRSTRGYDKRGRYDDDRSNGHRNNDVSRNDRDGDRNEGQRSGTVQRMNSRSTVQNSRQPRSKDDLSRSPSTSRDGFSPIHRTRPEVQRAPNATQINSDGKRRDYSPVERPTVASDNKISRQQAVRPSLNNKDVSRKQIVRPSENNREVSPKQAVRPSVNNKGVSRKQAVRPNVSNNNSSRQQAARPTAPIQRRATAPSPNVQRSGNGGGNKSVIKKKRGEN